MDLSREKFEIKLIDFGYTTTLQGTEISSNELIGSPLYMPPEIILDQKYTFASDIWSIGVIFYELL